MTWKPSRPCGALGGEISTIRELRLDRTSLFRFTSWAVAPRIIWSNRRAAACYVEYRSAWKFEGKQERSRSLASLQINAQSRSSREDQTMMSVFLRGFMRSAGATLLLVAISAPGLAQEKKYKPLVVRAPDGVTIAAQEWGNPSGPEILFIHGFSQASLSWQRQVESELAKEFRMVTYDLRGHGSSDKPLEPEKYKESKAWADEVQAVIDATKLKRPVMVGWSYYDCVTNQAETQFVRGIPAKS